MRVSVKVVVLCASLLVGASVYHLAGRSPYPRTSPPATDPVERHVWFTFVKAGANSPLGLKLEAMLYGLIGRSPGVRLHLNVIVDSASKPAATMIIERVTQHYPHRVQLIATSFYLVHRCAELLHDILDCMTPHFSSAPGSYYSDSLFYLSLGIHRIAPQNQNEIILLDCDLSFEISIEELFKEFSRFSSSNLIGLGYELSPVYRHVLHSYRTKNKSTPFGSELNYFSKLVNESAKKNIASDNANSHSKITLMDEISTNKFRQIKGFPGFNSGVILLNLKRLRQSQIFEESLKCDYVVNITKKYMFKGHLGDQDFFTLLGYEKPELFYTIDCGWNRQLCKWWRQYIESDIFDDYYKCDSPVRIYHGNCNTPIPMSQI